MERRSFVQGAGLAGILAAELGANIELSKQGGFLHDIGKALDHEIEGSHARIGADFLRRHGELEVVVNGVASHHGEVPSESIYGILVGAGLAIVLFLYRTMKPRVALLGRFPDGTLRDLRVHPHLPTDERIVVMRFDGQLYFANVSFFEDTILAAVADHPNARYVLVVGDGINQLDASGEEVVHHLVERLRDGGMEIVFSGLKKQILDVMRSTGLFDLIGQNNIFATEDQAIAAIYERLGDAAKDELFCALPARA